jgi:uncharacterized protein YciI
MLFAVYCLDAPGALEKRPATLPAHKTHIDRAGEFGISIVMAGPLAEDDGETPRGTLFVLDAPDRATVERFNAGDPYRTAGIWGEVAISVFLRRR